MANPVTEQPAYTVAELVRAARMLPVEERDRFLAQRCGDDASLRARLASILRARDEAAGHSPSVAAVATSSGAAPWSFGRIGRGDAVTLALFARAFVDGAEARIGPYRLVSRLGEGGFGVVYLAEQDVPVRRRVALKLIKRGMDTDQVLRRFEAEHAAMARMEHPGIVRVLDAGASDDGRPYFVMELIHGTAITAHCDAARMRLRDRLILFRRLCLAVDHAHRRGVVHRDLKPANVLIAMHDGEPAPKVIDFGVAKALRGRLVDGTLRTLTDQVIGTPEYMSPEQALATDAIDGRSDVYALGVILHELLVGVTPVEPAALRRCGIDEMRRLIAEQPTVAPSARVAALDGRLDPRAESFATARATTAGDLVRALRGSLDWIVLKALEKDPQRRYPTAAALAADMLRAIHDEPVAARPESLRRAGARLRPCRRALAAATLALCSLAGPAMVAASWRASRPVAESGRHDCMDALIDALRDETAIPPCALRAVARSCMLGEAIPGDGVCATGAAQTLVALLDRGFIDGARDVATSLRTTCGPTDADPIRAWATFVAAAADGRQGRVDEAMRRLDEADRLAGGIADGDTLRWRIAIERSRLAFRGGRFDEPERILLGVWVTTGGAGDGHSNGSALIGPDPRMWFRQTTHRAAAAAMHELCALRHEVDPGMGHDTAAERWRALIAPAFVTLHGATAARATHHPIACRAVPGGTIRQSGGDGGLRPLSPAALSATVEAPTVMPFHPPAARGRVPSQALGASRPE